MADEYIRKEDAIDCIEHITWYHVNRRGQLVDGANSDTGLYKAKDVYKGLHGIPSVDVVQVVHSTWIEDEGEGYHGIHCLRCGFSIPYGNVMMGYNFCPNCGAKMDGERKE